MWKCGPNEMSEISVLDFGEDIASPDKVTMKLILLIHPSGTADEGIAQKGGWCTVDKYNEGWQPLLCFPWYLKACVNFIFQVIKYNYHYLKIHHKHDINSSISNQEVAAPRLKDLTKQNLHRNTGPKWKMSGFSNTWVHFRAAGPIMKMLVFNSHCKA